MSMSFSEKYEKPFKHESIEECFKHTYDKAIEEIGIDRLKLCVPFSLEVLRERYREDKNFNNIPLDLWDCYAGFTDYGYTVVIQESSLRKLLREKGINSYTCSQGVSLLKEVARRLCENA